MDRDLGLESLLTLAAFETSWAYYYLSDGNLHGQACAGLAGQVAAFAGELDSLGQEADSMLHDMAAWAKGDDEAAIRLEDQYRNVLNLLKDVRAALVKATSLSFPDVSYDGLEGMYRASFMRWQANFPSMLLMRISRSGDILEQASNSRSIAVIGDIRRSQDLMTYAESHESFTDNIMKFIGQTRNLIDENMGIFDKFTGDGFLAYFNEAVCALDGLDYRECFLKFCRAELAFCREHFSQWTEKVRKLPEVEIGMSIGADVGHISFSDVNHHFIAVGDPIVWAQRMCSAAGADQTVVNNLLYRELSRDSSLVFHPLPGKTKAGEGFTAQVVELPGKWIS